MNRSPAEMARHAVDLRRSGTRWNHLRQHDADGRGSEMRWVLVAVMVFATVFGDVLQSYEMKRAGEQSVTAQGLAKLVQVIARRRLLILSILCNAASFFAFMA